MKVKVINMVTSKEKRKILIDEINNVIVNALHYQTTEDIEKIHRRFVIDRQSADMEILLTREAI